MIPVHRTESGLTAKCFLEVLPTSSFYGVRQFMSIQLIVILIASPQSVLAVEPEAVSEVALVEQELLPLSGLIDQALKHNPGVWAAKARWEGAKAKVAQAWKLERPWVSYDVAVGAEIQTRSGPQEARFGVSQEIPFPTKLPLRTQAAKLTVLQAEHQVLHVEQHIRSQVMTAYANLSWAQQAAGILREEQVNLEQLSSTIQAKYAVGERSASDAAKVEAELARLAERLLLVEQRRVAAEEQINVLLGKFRTVPWPTLDVMPPPEVPFSSDELVQMTLKHRHRLVIAQLIDEKKQVEHRLAKMEYLPDIGIGFSYTEIGGGTTTRSDDGEDAWMVPIKFSLPLWEPQIRGQVREARADQEAAKWDVQEEENRARADVIDRYTRYLSARERIGVYKATWLPQSEQALSSTKAAYEAGHGSILDLLDDERMVLEAKLGLLQSLVDTVTAYAALEQVVGIPLGTAQYDSTNTASDKHVMKGE